MALEAPYDFIVSLMPELKDLNLDIRELKGGITNKLYRVMSQEGHDYVFRIYGHKTELFIDREIESENLRRMQRSGVTPRLIRYSPEQNTTVVEFIPGYVLTPQDFLKEELWELIIRPIKIIHRNSVSLPSFFDPYVEVKRFQKILEGINPDYSEFDIHGTMNVLENISGLTNIPRSGYVPCHNDLLADNFILTQNQQKFNEPMFLIDWEYGGMAPPHYDMADMFQEILVPKTVEKNLLAIYWENRDLNYHEYMIELLKPFPDIYWFLWSLIQLNISTIPFGYYEYGRMKYENAQKNIKHLRDDYALKI